VQVLIVDDDPDFRRLTSVALEQFGIAFRAVGSADEARNVLAGPDGDNFDVLLLDVELPGTKGWEFLSSLRERGNEIPVIFVTVREALEDRVQGLSLGADDYIVKPFEFEELVARLHSVTRRRLRTQRIHVHDLIIDFELRRVERDGRSIDLSPREFEVLWCLAQASGRSVSQRELLHKLWGIDFDPESKVVEVHVFRLRKKLEARGTPLIETVRGEGYRLIM
jgi:two-component system OmpR family response regulator